MKRIAMIPCALAVAGLFAVPVASAARIADAGASGLDKQYLKTSLQGDLFEVIGGKLALKRSRNPAVTQLAERLVTDHSQSYTDAASIARKLGVDVPKTPAPTQVWELSVVRSLHGKAFNRWYSSLEVFDHRQDIQETTDEVKDGSNSNVVKDAKTELPTLREHLKLARAAVRGSK